MGDPGGYRAYYHQDVPKAPRTAPTRLAPKTEARRRRAEGGAETSWAGSSFWQRRYVYPAFAVVDLLEKAGAFQGTVLNENEVQYPEPLHQAEAPPRGLLPGTEAGTPSPQVFHVVGVPGVESPERRNLPGRPVFVLYLHHLRGRGQYVRVPLAYRLESSDQLPASYEVAVSYPEHAPVPPGPQVGAVKSYP